MPAPSSVCVLSSCTCNLHAWCTNTFDESKRHRLGCHIAVQLIECIAERAAAYRSVYMYVCAAKLMHEESFNSLWNQARIQLGYSLGSSGSRIGGVLIDGTGKNHAEGNRSLSVCWRTKSRRATTALRLFNSVNKLVSDERLGAWAYWFLTVPHAFNLFTVASENHFSCSPLCVTWRQNSLHLHNRSVVYFYSHSVSLTTTIL
jgi:hypothetical protein